MVAASPLRRTINTALLSFQPVFEAHKDFKVLCIPEAQETSDEPCDTGSDPAVLQKEFVDRGLPVDISLVHDGWNSKVIFFASMRNCRFKNADIRMQEGKWAPTISALRNRAREVRKWLKSRPEKQIVLVTHGGLLHYLTEDWEDGSMYQGIYHQLFFPSGYKEIKIAKSSPRHRLVKHRIPHIQILRLHRYRGYRRKQGGRRR